MSFSFKVHLYSWLVILGVFAGIYQMCGMRPSDLSAFQQHKERDREQREQPVASGTQYRYGVHKELWIQDEQRTHLHARLSCPSSRLFLIPHGHHMELTEQLSQVHCRMEEDGQTLRFWEADQATYSFSKRTLVARDVDMALWEMQDTQHPALQGHATQATLVWAEDRPRWEMENLQLARP